MWKRVFLLVILVFIVILTVIAKGERTPQQVPTLPEINNQAPSFKLDNLEGQAISLTSYRGKPVFINFWASWCPPCQAETPDLIDLYKKYHEKVGFVGINVTTQDRIEDVRAFVDDFHVNFPILLDMSGEISKTYRVTAMPTSFILNGDGVIIYKKIGPMTALEFERIINPFVK